jgi:phytoene dehydrogenase-like protein
MSPRYDALVIGANVGGLAAAALLAKSGARVLLLEEKLAPPEPKGPLFALDPVLVTALQLDQFGLSFRRRDLKLASWDAEAEPFILSRDEPRATARVLARFSRADADAWRMFQSELFSQARALRRWWFAPHIGGDAVSMLAAPGTRGRFAQESLMGADAFLSRYLETPRLVGTLLHDAVSGGLAPSEPGSALALIWRAAQEMAGQQGAVALAQHGSVSMALKAACGAELRVGAQVTEILVSRGAAGVRLADGDMIEARAVISSLTRARTERLAGQDRPASVRAVGTAEIALSLSEGFALPPTLDGVRAVLALTPQEYADAYEAARSGRLPSPLPLSLVAEGPRRLLLTAPLMPLAPPQGWAALQAPFAAAAVHSLRRHLPGLGNALAGVTVSPPKSFARAGLAQLLAPALSRAVTRVERLYLCGEEAEPVPCISGRAGRFAAHFAARALS